MLVFNVDDELSSSVLPSYYARMSHYRDFSDIPVFLVGIKGKFVFSSRCVNTIVYSLLKFGRNSINYVWIHGLAWKARGVLGHNFKTSSSHRAPVLPVP